MVHHAGACGCGRVEVHFVTALAPEQLQPRTDAATCRFCAAHDGVWISDPQGALRVRAADVTRVRTFAAGEVRFHFCEECDELVYATFSAGGREVGVVRLGVLPTIRRRPPTSKGRRWRSRGGGGSRTGPRSSGPEAAQRSPTQRIFAGISSR